MARLTSWKVWPGSCVLKCVWCCRAAARRICGLMVRGPRFESVCVHLNRNDMHFASLGLINNFKGASLSIMINHFYVSNKRESHMRFTLVWWIRKWIALWLTDISDVLCDQCVFSFSLLFSVRWFTDQNT